AITVSSGGFLSVTTGGLTVGGTILGAGSALISGGITSNMVVSGNGGTVRAFETLSAGGSAVSTTLQNTGVLAVSSGGVAINTLVLSTNLGLPTGSTGALAVSSGGSATGTIVSSGGTVVERG